MATWGDFMAALGGFGTGTGQGLADVAEARQKQGFQAQQQANLFGQQQTLQSGQQRFQAGQQERALGQAKEMGTIPSELLHPYMDEREKAAFPAGTRLPAATAKAIQDRVIPYAFGQGFARVGREGVNVLQPAQDPNAAMINLMKMFRGEHGATGPEGAASPPGGTTPNTGGSGGLSLGGYTLFPEVSAGTFRNAPRTNFSLRPATNPNTDVYFSNLAAVRQEHPDWTEAQQKNEAMQRAGAPQANVAGQKAEAGAKGRQLGTAAGFEEAGPSLLNRAFGLAEAAVRGRATGEMGAPYLASPLGKKNPFVVDKLTGEAVDARKLSMNEYDQDRYMPMDKTHYDNYQNLLGLKKNYADKAQIILDAAAKYPGANIVQAVTEYTKGAMGLSELKAMIASLKNDSSRTSRLWTGTARGSEYLVQMTADADAIDLKDSASVAATKWRNFMRDISTLSDATLGRIRPGGEPQPPNIGMGVGTSGGGPASATSSGGATPRKGLPQTRRLKSGATVTISGE